MANDLQPGQRFKLSNPDWMVYGEDWTVVAVDGDQVTFDYIQHNVVDRAYVPYTSEGTAAGTIVRRDGDQLILSFTSFGDSFLKGLLLEGATATYLIELDPPKFF
jgi:hypothetical protein